MHKSIRKLRLAKESLCILSAPVLEKAAGGLYWTRETMEITPCGDCWTLIGDTCVSCEWTCYETCAGC